ELGGGLGGGAGTAAVADPVGEALGDPQRGGGRGVSAGGDVGGLVGDDDPAAGVAEQAEDVGVDDDPGRRRASAGAGLGGGAGGGDGPVGGGGRVQQARHALQGLRDQHGRPAGPGAVPGVRDGGDRGVGELGVVAQLVRGPAHAQHQAALAPGHAHRALVPQLLAGLAGGAVGVDDPAVVGAAAQPQGAGGGDRGAVVAPDAVAQ